MEELLEIIKTTDFTIDELHLIIEKIKSIIQK